VSRADGKEEIVVNSCKRKRRPGMRLAGIAGIARWLPSTQ
jgi:hypothetical protein